jgi:hypothetical protein
VLGLTVIVAPGGVAVLAVALVLDVPVMVVVVVGSLPIFFLYGRIEGWEGALFPGYCVA